MKNNAQPSKFSQKSCGSSDHLNNLKKIRKKWGIRMLLGLAALALTFAIAPLTGENTAPQMSKDQPPKVESVKNYKTLSEK